MRNILFFIVVFLSFATSPYVFAQDAKDTNGDGNINGKKRPDGGVLKKSGITPSGSPGGGQKNQTSKKSQIVDARLNREFVRNNMTKCAVVLVDVEQLNQGTRKSLSVGEIYAIESVLRCDDMESGVVHYEVETFFKSSGARIHEKTIARTKKINQGTDRYLRMRFYYKSRDIAFKVVLYRLSSK